VGHIIREKTLVLAAVSTRSLHSQVGTIQVPQSANRLEIALSQGCGGTLVSTRMGGWQERLCSPAHHKKTEKLAGGWCPFGPGPCQPTQLLGCLGMAMRLRCSCSQQHRWVQVGTVVESACVQMSTQPLISWN